MTSSSDSSEERDLIDFSDPAVGGRDSISTGELGYEVVGDTERPEAIRDAGLLGVVGRRFAKPG